MAPCCEPKELAEHQPLSVLLISVNDLALFDNWPACRTIKVEHGSDGAADFDIDELWYRNFKAEQARNWPRLRHDPASVRQYIETMYVLDLALDRRSVSVDVKEVPCGADSRTCLLS